MSEWLLHFSSQHQILVYAVIIVLACAEGPILSILFGALIKTGAFSFWPVYIALMVGDLIGDTIWYQIGRHVGMRFVRRFGKYFSVTESRVKRITEVFNKYHEKILIVSKLTCGFGFAVVTLMVAGMVKIPFLRYLTINFVGQFVWTGMLIGVGYFIGNLYAQANSIMEKVSIAALFVIVILALNGYRKYMSKRMKISGD